jgi:hypothetical protein
MLGKRTPSALAAKAVTKTVPIVFATGDDPVREGLVASLNRPGGNLTGVSFITVELGAKQLGLLRELRPGVMRIAVLADPKFPTTERFVSDVRAAASAMGQQIEVLYVGSDREIETAFTTLVQHGAGALLPGSGGFLYSRRERIVALAARHRIPAIYILSEHRHPRLLRARDHRPCRDVAEGRDMRVRRLAHALGWQMPPQMSRLVLALQVLVCTPILHAAGSRSWQIGSFA